MALLTAEDAKIDDFDGETFATEMGGSRRTFEVLPGRHRLGVSVLVVAGGPESASEDFKRSGTRTMCFVAVPGNTYVARPIQDGTFTNVELFNRSTGAIVATACTGGAPTSDGHP